MLCIFLLTLTLSIVIGYHFIFVSYLVHYHKLKLSLTNLSAIIWPESFFLLLLITLLSSMKTIVPFLVNTSLRTRSYTVTGKKQVRKNMLENQIFLQTRVIRDEWKKFCVMGEEWKVWKWAKGGMHQKRLGTTVLSIPIENTLIHQNIEQATRPTSCLMNCAACLSNEHGRLQYC